MRFSWDPVKHEWNVSVLCCVGVNLWRDPRTLISHWLWHLFISFQKHALCSKTVIRPESCQPVSESNNWSLNLCPSTYCSSVSTKTKIWELHLYYMTVSFPCLSLQCNKRIKFGKLALKCKGNCILYVILSIHVALFRASSSPHLRKKEMVFEAIPKPLESWTSR